MKLCTLMHVDEICFYLLTAFTFIDGHSQHFIEVNECTGREVHICNHYHIEYEINDFDAPS